VGSDRGAEGVCGVVLLGAEGHRCLCGGFCYGLYGGHIDASMPSPLQGFGKCRYTDGSRWVPGMPVPIWPLLPSFGHSLLWCAMMW
jgi:hypothetical protein